MNAERSASDGHGHSGNDVEAHRRTQHPDQRESSLASTKEDATLAEQILGDSPMPGGRHLDTTHRDER